MHSDGLDAYLSFGLDFRIDGHQVVAPVHLHAVTGVIEEAGGVLLQAAREPHDGLLHALLVGVFQAEDFEAEIAQRLRHGAGVVHGIAQWRGGVVGVADDESDPVHGERHRGHEGHEDCHHHRRQ